MTTVRTTFGEPNAPGRTASVPLSHVSIELGHLYLEDFEAGPSVLRERLARTVPWVNAASSDAARRASELGVKPRVSTCFLVDDYFSRSLTPAQVLPPLLEAARDVGLTLDYLARESACAETDGLPLAASVEARLVPAPAPGARGARPPTAQTGWLSNGVRSSDAELVEAMSESVGWSAPSENEARGHSVFVDVELWKDDGRGGRTWSCPFLAAVWQLMRLGLLRYEGRDVVQPRPLGEPADDWDAIPALSRLRPGAAPFSAYRTFSVMDGRFLPVEHAVRVILEQTAPDAQALRQSNERAVNEGFVAGDGLPDRISYFFHD